MKHILYLAIFVSFVMISCEESEPVVGSTQETSIANLSFTVDTTYLDAANSRLVAKGSVKNNWSSQVTSPWYVECQFYTNAGMKRLIKRV